MKRIIAILCIASLALGITSTALAYTAETTPNYFFAGERYGISNIDTNGEIFVGINQNKIAVSRDFENWEVLHELDDVTAVQYLQGRFCAFTKGYTYVSSDGATWNKVENNLTLIPQNEYIIKNNGSVVLFARDENYANAGTYQTFDGITWKRVQNIPDGIWMSHVNGMIMFESTGYMRGFYYSETGEEFTHLTIDGYDESYGGFNLEFNGNEYTVCDFWRSGDSEPGYLYRSADLKEWPTERIPRNDTVNLNNPNGHYININGEWHALSQNGYDWVYKDGGWQQGQYHGMTGLIEYSPDDSVIPNQAYVYYNFTDYGIFAWSTNNNSAFIKNNGEMLQYNGQERNISSFFVKDGKFIGQNWSLEGQWESENGKDWIKTNTKDDYGSYHRSVKSNNGSSDLESEIIERGSWRYHEDNKEITAVLTENGGSTKKIFYEGTKSSDCVTVFGGNGYYIMGNDEGRYWLSRDGITRDEYIEFPDSTTNLYANDKYFFCSTQSGILHIGEMSQFEGLPSDNAVKVRLGDEYLSFEISPVIDRSRTLVSARFLFEKMGAKVGWNDEKKAAYIHFGENFDNYIEVAIGSNTALVNGEEKPLDCPAQLINEKTMLPLRFIAEEMGYTVNYDANTKTAEVTDAD
ncbi:MAG: copper amine oxidase N-terminal domain-containing protein [Clostridia bacterium]|nr:copper amine oxidase N-terminal domain-containing protein [Clostridia bacterium]